jgi:chitinase
MKKMILFFLFAFALLSNSFAQNKKLVIGYYNWDNSAYPHSAIDFSNLTHLCHAFIWPAADGYLDASEIALYPSLISTAHSNGVKVLVSIGGYGTAAQTKGFKDMVNNATARATFIKNLVDFIKANNYDGADFDLEYPGSSERANFATLLIDVRAAFKTNNIPLLSAAVPASDWNGGYDVAKIKDVLDWIGIMTYDFTGPWDPVGTTAYHNSALYTAGKQDYSIDNSVSSWYDKGMPKSKICIGMPFYGYLINASDILSGITSTSGEKSLSYNTIASSYLNNSDWEYKFDNSTKNPYLRNKAHTQIITFDDTTSTRLKCEYVNNKSLAGTIIWKIAQSYNGKTNPLLETVGKYLLKSVVSVEANDNVIPSEYSLSNFPNPFNTSTTITYSIPSQERSALVNVKISIYDMLGRNLGMLLEQEQSAGVHKVVFNANGLPSGIYLCKLEAGSHVELHKLIFSK